MLCATASVPLMYRLTCAVCQAEGCCEQADELRSRITGFAARWEGLKPKGVPSGDPALILIKMQEYGKQLTDLQVLLLYYHVGSTVQTS